MAFEVSQIGELAGVVWRTLESRGTLNLEELQNESGLDLVEVVAGIGWLALEGKISFSKENGVTSVRLYQERYY